MEDEDDSLVGAMEDEGASLAGTMEDDSLTGAMEDGVCEIVAQRFSF